MGINAWDVLIVGDGSGSTWDRAAGWGAVTIERETGHREVHAGLVNRGTVNFAELMAYVQALDWLASRERDRRDAGSPARAYRVHIITDSDYCRVAGSRSPRMAKKNVGLLSILNTYVRQGFVLKWHHLPRENCALNSYADKLSKLMRKLVEGYNPRRKLAEAQGRTVAEINPAGECYEGWT